MWGEMSIDFNGGMFFALATEEVSRRVSAENDINTRETVVNII
jgi:hypothetical protein